MNRVEIAFDCLPLRSVNRLDIPLDASPGYRQKCEAIKTAIEKHGTHNSYFLHNASCEYFLINAEDVGRIRFRFEGTALTDAKDLSCASVDLDVELQEETCEWLTEPIVQWFHRTVQESVKHEFDRYIQAGDLNRTQERLRQLNDSQAAEGGFLGMYL